MIRTYEGIVLRQTKIMGGRRMVLIFTREEGKISAGTRISEKSKGGAALAIRPFAYGHYTISEKGELRTISSAETIDAFFALGEDMDRFAEASFVLEFADKLLPEGACAPRVFDLLRENLGMLSRRKSGFRLLTISYMIKLMQEFGVFPDRASLAGSELLSGLNDDILETIVFISEQAHGRMDSLRLESEKERIVFGIVRAFAQRYLDLGTMKSERILA